MQKLVHYTKDGAIMEKWFFWYYINDEVFFGSSMHNCLGYMTIYEKDFFFSMLKFGHHFVLTVSNMQKCNPLKKLCLVYFLQKWLKNIKSQYSEIIMLGVFFKRLKWCFWIFKILRYFNHFWKNKQGKAFSTDDLLHICHIPNKMVNKK